MFGKTDALHICENKDSCEGNGRHLNNRRFVSLDLVFSDMYICVYIDITPI